MFNTRTLLIIAALAAVILIAGASAEWVQTK